MAESVKNLGKLIDVHGTSPIFLQRAAIVAGLTFVFFLAMLIVFYTRQQIGYLVLATAFLVVNFFTMIGLFMQKRNVVKVHENGFRYRNTSVSWHEITIANSDEHLGLVIAKMNGEQLTIPRSVEGLNKLADHIRDRIPH